MERREFLAASAALVAAPALPALAADADEGQDAARAATSRTAALLAAPSQSAFTALVDRHFLFHPAGRGVALRLTRVLDATSPASPQLRQFSLVFAGGAPALPSGTYEVDAPGMQRLQMYVERIGPLGGEELYRADFALL